MQFRLGINYWPITSAMYWWQRFDAAEVARDFKRIRDAGFDTVRIFLLWEDFQPQPQVISKYAMKNLTAVAGIAADEGLSLIVTFFTGHMSGVNWLPVWTLESRAADSARFRIVSGGQVVNAVSKNWYTDSSLLAAQTLLVREVAGTLCDHSAVWAWDLGNENSNCVMPPSRQAGLDWLQRIASEIRSVDSAHSITIGLHTEDLEEDRKLGPQEAATVADFLCMHGYPIYSSWAAGPTDALMLPFLGVITRWLGGKDVLFEEFGAATIPPGFARDQHETATGPALLDKKQAAEYTRKAVEHLHQGGFLGAAVWCYGDYATSLWSSPPLDKATHERWFGLWQSDGLPKPAVEEIGRISGVTRREFEPDLAWIDIESENYYENPRQNLVHLYRRFRETMGAISTNV
jgi:endo-1,4-beta-mannosidase